MAHFDLASYQLLSAKLDGAFDRNLDGAFVEHSMEQLIEPFDGAIRSILSIRWISRWSIACRIGLVDRALHGGLHGASDGTIDYTFG